MQPGIVPPNFVSDVKVFPQATLSCLEEQSSGTFSGVSKDGNLCWVVSGPSLEVLQVSTCTRVAAWRFGQVLGDQHTNITCVKELGVGQSVKLLVGLCNSSPNGLVCVFDVALCKVTSAVEMPQPVTELELVCTCKQENAPRWALSEHLRHFCGIVAVGTSSGHVYLMDLCLDDKEFFSDEEVSSRVHMIWPRHRDIENQRFHCMSQGLHLCVPLNDPLFTDVGFEYQKPDGVVMKTFRPDAVSVTCLTYVPQAGILLVGYNFGCYQIWKLTIPVLEYSSRLESDPMPVTHIAYQEPENDPKNFCYLWVARGPLMSDESRSSDMLSNISLYQLTFNQRTVYSNYGVFYEDLASVCLRLDHELTASLVHTGSNFEGSSRVLVCHTLSDPAYQPPAKLRDDDSFEEGGHGADLSLCLFVWETVEGGRTQVSRHMAIFDINRWYHAQMPATVRYVSGSMDTCSYMGFYDVVDKADSVADNLLTAHVKVDRLRKFISNSAMPPEQHFYPSSLAFDVTLVLDCGLVDAQYLGTQRQVLASLKKNGPSVLVQPHDVYGLCVRTGLLPRPTDIASINPSLMTQREAVLSLTLEYNMVDFIHTCITQWAGGEYEQHGCTLKFLLDWAWTKVSAIKHQIDITCVNLYNWSGLGLDQRAMHTLLQCKRKLGHLSTIFKTLSTQAGPVTQQGQEELENRMLVTGLLSQHFDAVLWFVGAGILPELDDTEDVEGPFYCYPVTSLISAYKTRRTQLANIHSDMADTDLLMIDGLVEHIGVRELWDREGGSGSYPPPSLHALLSTYLLEKVDLLSKHCLVLYLLLDLVSVDGTEDTMSPKVSAFARRFQLPHTLVKLIQAFWLLDHQDFQEAMVLLLDPLVTVEYSRWQHKRIIKALLYQGHAKMALRYLTSISPALNTPEEVKLKLTVLLANGMTSEALEYQRKCRDKTNMRDLLAHLYLGSQQTSTVERLLQLPLTPDEEAVLVQYLMESPEPGAQEVLVMHYLQRARFVEAIQLNERLKQDLLTEPSSAARERAVARNAIIDRYSAILPCVQRRLLYEHMHVPKKNVQLRREVQRPTPLSTKVTKNKVRMMSQSTFVLSIMEKLDEIDPTTAANQTLNATVNKSVGPFVCTPVTLVRKSLKSTPATSYPDTQSRWEENENNRFSLRKSLAMFQPTSGTSSPATDRRKSKFYSASCLSILQTPTVTRMTPRLKQRQSIANVITPQSILKVRSTITTVSPSPQSATTTPNSQVVEIESSMSQRRVPRKLGYGSVAAVSTTPLSSVPRHLKADLTPAHAPPSPKSVSFAEPPLTPESPEPAANMTRANPLTPKSVSFLELAEMASPPAEKAKQRSDSILLGSSHLLKDRSPTPESSQNSPKFVGKMDELLRQSLRTPASREEEEISTSKEAVRPPAGQENVSVQPEISDEEISDEEVEEMEHESESLFPASSNIVESHLSSPSTSPQKSPSQSHSPTVKVSKSATSEFSGEVAAQLVREVQQQDVDLQTARPAGDVKQATVNVDLTADEEEMVVDDDGVTSSQPAEIEDELVVSADEEIFKDFEEVPAAPTGEVEVSSSVGEGELLDAPVEVEESVKVETADEDEWVDARGTRTSPVQQQTEYESGIVLPELKRKSLTPPSERPPLKLKDSPPDTGYEQAGTSTTPSRISPTAGVSQQSAWMTEIDNKFSDSSDVEQDETKFQPKDVNNEEATSRPRFSFTRRTFKTATVPVKQEKGRYVYSEEMAGPSSAGEAGPSSPVKEETEDVPMTPTRSSRRLRGLKEEASSSEQEEPVTPTRSSRRLRATPPRSSQRQQKLTKSPARSKDTENLVKISAPSKLSFSAQAKEAVNESLLHLSSELRTASKESDTDTEMTKLKPRKSLSPAKGRKRTPSPAKGRKRTPSPSGSSRSSSSSDESEQSTETPPKSSQRLKKTTHSSARSKKQHSNEEAENDLVQISAPSALSFSGKAKELVNESLLQLSAEIKASKESDTAIKYLELRKSVSPVKERKNSPSPSGSRRMSPRLSPVRSVSSHTPTRVSSRLAGKSGPSSDESVNVTPSRRKNIIKESVASTSKPTGSRTPRRGKKKQESESASKISKSDGNVNNSADLLESVYDVDTGDNVDSNRLTDDNLQQSDLNSFGKTDIPEDFVNTAIGTVTRRQTLSHTGRTGVERHGKARTPSRRLSLSHSSETLIEEESEIGASEGLTLTRARLRSRNQESDVESQHEMEGTSKKRGSRKKSTSSNVENIENETLTATPSKRGRHNISEVIPENETLDTDAKPATPSRRGRPRKVSENEAKPMTPSRKGKGSKLDSTMELETGDNVPNTPSRRSRRNTTAVDASDVIKAETEVGSRTPTRGRRRNTTQVSASDVAEAEQEVSVRRTPGRRRNTTQISAAEVAEAEQEVSVKRTPGRRRNTTQVSASDVAEAENKQVPRTPTRGRRNKAEVEAEVSEPAEDVAESVEEKTEDASPSHVTHTSPSRSKRAKTESGSPTRHTRSHDQPHMEMELASAAPDVFEIHSTSFQFSDPTHVDMETGGVTPMKAVSTTRSFIFSPPISRSVAADMETSTATTETVTKEMENSIRLLPLPPDNETQETAQGAKKKIIKKRKKKLYTETDSVLLISPPVSGQSDGETTNPFTPSTRAATRRSTASKDGTQALLHYMGRRKKRTSYRIGPIKSKK